MSHVWTRMRWSKYPPPKYSRVDVSVAVLLGPALSSQSHEPGSLCGAEVAMIIVYYAVDRR